MKATEHLSALLHTQKQTLRELEAEITALSAQDFLTENSRLKRALEQSAARCKQAEQTCMEQKKELSTLRDALHARLYSEKQAALNASSSRLSAYYQGKASEEETRLATLEKTIRGQIDRMEEQARAEDETLLHDMTAECGRLRAMLEERLAQIRRDREEAAAHLSEQAGSAYTLLQKEPLTEQEAQAALRKRRLESLIGLNVLNKLGVLLVVIGAVAAARFTYTKLPDAFKGGMLFLLAFAFLIMGEWMGWRGKRADLFSLGLVAGGVALLYVSVVTCFLWLDLLPLYAAFVLVVLVTALAFFLSQRHNAQGVAAFAMIGGYLPVLVFFFQPKLPLPFLLCSAGYTACLCLFSLLTACRKKWIVAQFISFVLNTAACIIIASFYNEFLTFSPPASQGLLWLCRLIPCLLIACSFLAFLAGPLVYAARAQARLKLYDLILQGLNLATSYTMLFLMVDTIRGADRYAFVQPLCFTLVLAGAACFLWKRAPKARAGLYAVAGGAVFVSLLIVPVQFGFAYAVYAWSAEALLFLLPGLLWKRRAWETAGWLAEAAAALALLIAYPMLQLTLQGLPYLPSRAAAYTCFTLSTLLVLAAILYNGKESNLIQGLFKYGVILNLWVYTIFAAQLFLPALLPVRLGALHTDLFLLSATILAGCAVACFSIRMPRLRDDATAIIGLLIYACSFIMAHIANCLYFRQADGFPRAVRVGLLLLQIAANIASVFAAADFTDTLVRRFRAPVEVFSLSVSAVFTVLLTELLLGQFRLAFTNPLIGILYLLTALGWILCGFWRRYAAMRRFGLGLTFLALGKLLLIDLASLSEGKRILAFFGFGALMILISFVYRHFSKRMLPSGSIAQIPAQEEASATRE